MSDSDLVSNTAPSPGLHAIRNEVFPQFTKIKNKMVAVPETLRPGYVRMALTVHQDREVRKALSQALKDAGYVLEYVGVYYEHGASWYEMKKLENQKA